MTPTQWVLVAGLLMLCGVLAAGWLGVQVARAPYLPPSFDEHAATAAALLQPDAPLFTHAEQQQTADVAVTPFADEVQAWLLSRTPTIRPAFPEES